MQYKTKYKFLDINFNTQDTLLKLTNKNLRFFVLVTLLKLSPKKIKWQIKLSLSNSLNVSHKYSVQKQSPRYVL